MRVFAVVAQVGLGLWVGAMAGVAFVVAPAVFGAMDDNKAAGDMLGPVFRRVDMFGMAVALAFALSARTSWVRWTAGCMSALAAANLFFVAPRVASEAGDVNTYHRISEGIWGLLLVAGIVLLIRAARRPASG